MPAAATQDWMETNNGKLYVPTRTGVVIVDGATKTMTEPRGNNNVVAMAFVNDAAWLLIGDGGLTLEKWDLQLTNKQLDVPLEPFEPGGMVGVGDSFYLATADRGLLHFDNDGKQVNAIADVGYSFDPGFGAGSIWVPDYDTGEVIRIDPARPTPSSPGSAWLTAGHTASRSPTHQCG